MNNYCYLNYYSKGEVLWQLLFIGNKKDEKFGFKVAGWLTKIPFLTPRLYQKLKCKIHTNHDSVETVIRQLLEFRLFQ